jgi:hypothetical protein
MALSTPVLAVPDKVRALDLDEDPDLFQHVKRPQWGLAILAFEKGDNRAYQFEDGRLRKFKRGYFDLMKPASSKRRTNEAVIADLQAALGVDPAPRRTLTPVAPFDAQVGLFLALYPKGFRGERWTDEHRGTKGGRPLKRHRDHVIERVREELSADRLTEWRSKGDLRPLTLAVLDVLGSTNLVSARHVKTLRGMDDSESTRFAETATSLLHGDGDFGPRFREWVTVLRDTLGGKPSWRMATALPALSEPNEHVCVRHSAFIRQAAAVAPTSKYTRRARVGAYRNFRRVAQGVRTRLEASGQQPRDLLDVHDFIWTTLRGSAIEHLEEGQPSE